jgi:putative nucleotidyltransferase with HDIG domain
MNNEVLMHSMNVADIAMKIAQSMRIGEKAAIEIQIAAFFHDIGKEYIPKVILNNPEKLTNDEFEIVKMHTKFGYRMLIQFDNNAMKTAAEVALNHHERYDGSGYTNKFNREISLAARIVAVADVYDALISDRVYHLAMSMDAALFYLQDNAGKLFDPSVVQALINTKEGGLKYGT